MGESEFLWRVRRLAHRCLDNSPGTTKAKGMECQALANTMLPPCFLAVALKKSTTVKQRRHSDQTLGKTRTVLHATLLIPHRLQGVGPLVGSILWMGKLSRCIPANGVDVCNLSSQTLFRPHLSPTGQRKERITFRNSLGGGQMTGK